jgi:hypothetical protein
LVKPIANWDVEVGDFAIIECVASGRFIEGVLVVEDALFEMMDLILVAFCCDGGGGLSVGDGL